jgi:hypothetical protein
MDIILKSHLILGLVDDLDRIRLRVGLGRFGLWMVRAGVWDLRRSVAMDYFGLPVFEEF